MQPKILKYLSVYEVQNKRPTTEPPTLKCCSLQAVAEHAGTITGQVDKMSATRLIWASERSTLSEALLVAAAGTRQAAIQTQVKNGQNRKDRRYFNVSRMIRFFFGCRPGIRNIEHSGSRAATINKHNALSAL